MSIHSVLTAPRHAEQASAPVEFNPRLRVHQGEDDSCWSTAVKVAGVIAGILASIASFVFGGPIIGAIVTLIAGAAGLYFLTSCCGSSSHNHTQTQNITVPWYQRMFSLIPTGNNAPGGGNAPHVRVGGGHINAAPVARPWYESWIPFTPDGVRHMDGGPHVPVGRGHGRGGHTTTTNPHVPVGGGHGAHAHGHAHGGGGHAPHGAHVPVGRGHAHGGPTTMPPPGGPGGHVPVGRRN